MQMAAVAAAAATADSCEKWKICYPAIVGRTLLALYPWQNQKFH